NSVETAPEGRGVRDNPPPHALGSSEGADTHSRLSEPDAANVAKPHDDPTAHRVADLRAQSQPTDEPPAVDVAPIAKLTVRDGLVQRAGLYAPGLPDGDHDVFPVPLSPKGELRPHVLAEPPSGWRPIETAPTLGKWVLLWWPDVTDAAFVGYYVDGQWRAATSGDRWPTLPGPTHWMPLPEGPSVTKDAGECGACDKPGEHCANVHGICSRHGGRAHEQSNSDPAPKD